jgi:hypothetical protein
MPLSEVKMGEATSKEVLAEVLLRKPEGAAMDRVAHFLQQKGVQVSSRGAMSLSIRCPAAVFEELFQARLRPAAPEPSSTGVRDFGSGGRVAYETDDVITVPAGIAADVEGVYLQKPARLL